MNKNDHIRTDTSPEREAHLRELARGGDQVARDALAMLDDAREVVGDGLRVYRVEDGANHWVIARDAATAVEVVLREHYEGKLENTDWEDGQPEGVYIETLRSLAGKKFTDHERTDSMLLEVLRDPTERYFACSEF